MPGTMQGMGLGKELKKLKKKSRRELQKATSKMAKNFTKSTDTFETAMKRTVSKVGKAVEGVTKVGERLVKKVFPNGRDSVAKFIGKNIRAQLENAVIAGQVVSAVGDMMIVVGEFTGQPELITVGLAVDEAGNAVVVGAQTAAEATRALEYTIQGNNRMAMIALARATEIGYTGFLNSLSRGTFDNFVAAVVDMANGDFEGATRQIGQAALDAISDELNVPPNVVLAEATQGQVTNQIADTNQSTVVNQTTGNGIHGGAPTDPGVELDPGIVSANPVPDQSAFPGGEMTASASPATSVPIAPPKPIKKENIIFPDRDPVTQNRDADLTMCGQGMEILHNAAVDALEKHVSNTPRIDGEGDVYFYSKLKGANRETELMNAMPSFVLKPKRSDMRSYGSVKNKPVQFKNASFVVGTQAPFPMLVRKTRHKLSERREKYRTRSTVRGFSSNTSKKRQSAHGSRDARGDVFSLTKRRRAVRPRIQGDEITYLRERSMDMLKTIAKDEVQKTQDGGKMRSRSVLRSTAMHEKQMASVLASEGL